MAILSIPLMFVFVFFMQMALGGELVMSFWKGNHLKLVQDGVETFINLTMGGRNSPPNLYLQKKVSLGFNLMIFKENFVTRGLNKLGALKDMKLGIPSFDDHLYVHVSDETAAMNYLHTNARHAAVEQFFQWGFNMMQGSDKVIHVSKSYYSDADLEPYQMRMYLEELKKLMV
jgi:hypothetical protein